MSNELTLTHKASLTRLSLSRSGTYTNIEIVQPYHKNCPDSDLSGQMSGHRVRIGLSPEELVQIKNFIHNRITALIKEGYLSREDIITG